MAEIEHTEVKTTTTTHTHEEPKQDLLSNLLAIAGLIVLAVIVIWGLLHLAKLVAPSLSSFFSRTPRIEVTAPKDVTSGEAFNLVWKHSASEKGTYALLYQCKEGFSLETPNLAGVVNTVPCGAAYTAGSETTKALSLTPRLSGETALDATLSIIFVPSATTSKRIQGNATTKVHPAEAKAPEPESQTSTPAAPVSHSTGPADVSVSITSATVDQYGNAVVTFDIANIGGSASPSYYFSAQLPTTNGYTYTSPQQSSLGAGDRVANTLRFSQAVGGVVSVTVSIADSNSSNNYASQNMSAPYSYNTPSYNTYQTGTQYYAPQTTYYNPNQYMQPTYTNPNSQYYQYQYNQPYPNYTTYPQYPYYTY